jgi:sugar lactone lactonase YvrE
MGETSMNIKFCLLAALGLAASAIAHAASAAGPATLERWRTYAGVTWAVPQPGKPVAAFAGSVGSPLAGIHFDGKGRAFVSTPRLITAAAPATLSILDTDAESGPARLTAFPSIEANAVDGAPATHLRNVLGFHVDHRNGWLWALDQGYVAGEDEAPPGAQKIVVFDLRTGAAVRTIGLDTVADRKGSFLNDIAIDEERKVAYVSDSGLRSAPANQAGLIVVDYASGQARRVLDRHPVVLPQPGNRVIAGGAEVWPGRPLLLGVNGIALSPDAQTLYWTVTTGTRAYAVPTALLRDRAAGTPQVAAAVRDLGDVGGNTDGIVTDRKGRLYITDVSRNGIVRYDPGTRAMTLLAADARVHWPDTPAIAADGALVFTASSLNRHFAGEVKPGEERYELWRLPVH